MSSFFMPNRLSLILIAIVLFSGGCIFAPTSSDPVQDAGTEDTFEDDRCPDCLGTWAGTGVRGASEGPRLSAQFDTLTDIAFDSSDASVYLSDRFAHRIWRVQDGQVKTFAGTGSCSVDAGGEDAAGELCDPLGIEVVAPERMYVTECSTGHIKRISSGTIETVAGVDDDEAPWDGVAPDARLECPSDITLGEDNRLYIAGNASNRIHEFYDGRLSVLAGGDAGFEDSDDPDNVRFRNPTQLVYDADNERLIVVDRANHCLREVSLAAGERGATTTIAGRCEEPGVTEPGPAGATRFADLHGVEFDGDTLYVFSRSQLVAIDFATPELRVEAVLGIDAASHHRDGPADRAKLHAPRALTPYVDELGQRSILIAESLGRTVRKWKYVDPAGDLGPVPGEADGPTIETVAGTGFRGRVRGDAAQAEFASPSDIVRFGDRFLIADRLNHQILEYQDDQLSVFAGTGQCAPVPEQPVEMTEANLCQPSDLFVDGRSVYVVQRANHVVSRIDSELSMISTVVGSSRPGTPEWNEANWQGNPLEVKLLFPDGVTMDADGALYIAGGSSHAIHRLDANGDQVDIFAGNANDAGFDNRNRGDSRFFHPRDIVHVDGSFLVADFGNHCVRRIQDDSVETAFGKCQERGGAGGPPQDARFDLPLGLLSTDYDADEALELIILDQVGVSIVDGEEMQVQRLGAPWEGWRDGALDVVGLTRPTGVALTDDGDLLVTEQDGDRLRRITF